MEASPPPLSATPPSCRPQAPPRLKNALHLPRLSWGPQTDGSHDSCNKTWSQTGAVDGAGEGDAGGGAAGLLSPARDDTSCCDGDVSPDPDTIMILPIDEKMLPTPRPCPSQCDVCKRPLCNWSASELSILVVV